MNYAHGHMQNITDCVSIGTIKENTKYFQQFQTIMDFLLKLRLVDKR
jgi:hypothetical protein